VGIRAALGALEATPRIVRAKEGAAPVDLVLATTAVVSGQVTDQVTGRPVAGARVDLRPEGPPPGRGGHTRTTDREGRFEVVEVIPGPWQVTATHAEYLKGRPQTLQIDAVDREAGIHVRLDPGLGIGGVVVDPEGRVVAEANVRIEGTSEDGARVRKNLRTGPDGRFGATGFVRGTYRAVARREGYRNASLPDLFGGETALRLEMRPWAPPPRPPPPSR
jgi:hypothetical protein